jgi:diaminopimelate decarboxylase
LDKEDAVPLDVRSTAADLVSDFLLPDDSIDLTDGRLRFDGSTAEELLERFGSPLYVVSEPSLRRNFRRIRAAFADAWPQRVDALYAIKANNNLAIRRVLAQEGAGSDCFGPAELYATMLGGANPDLVVLNGSNKSPEELAKAVELGLRVNIDAVDEIELLDRLAREARRTVRVNLRLKTVPPEYADLDSPYFGLVAGEAVEAMRAEKWGFSETAAAPLVEEILGREWLVLDGYHHHIGRISAAPAPHAAWARDLAGVVERLADRTGYWPRLLDIGGGWARERDAESASLQRNPFAVEEYAAAVCEPLVELFASRRVEAPRLFIEPGRFVVGSAVTLLCTVGAIKEDLGLRWVNVDASTNDLMRIDTAGSAHPILPADGLDREIVGSARVVGSTCAPSVLGTTVPLPALRRGDRLAILDAGMYAETSSTQFNGVPRPATVMVAAGQADLIKERETVLDVFARHRIPERLASLPGRGADAAG